MKGGYAQWKSNEPLVNTSTMPNGSAGGKWQGQLANPPTFSSVNNCVDNYNHFTKKGAPSPVLDKAN